MANNNGKVTVMDREAELHNARINNMYSILSNAGSDELESLWEQAKQAAHASVVAPEKPATPEYEHTPVNSDIFTAETLDRTIGRSAATYAPSYMPMPSAPAVETQKAEEVVFSLTSAAKKAIAIFASAATVMMTLICVNTNVIKAQNAKLAALEASNASARAQLAQIHEDIEHYGSEEVIYEWAAEQGLVQK